MALNARALVLLSLACSMMATLAQSDICCDDYAYFSSDTSTSNTFYYRKYYDGTPPTFYGTISVGYASPRCTSCASATYSLKPSSCKYDGSLPNIRSFKCTYALTYISAGFVDAKEKRSKQPCYFSSDVSKSLNETHYEQCTVSYIGVASSEFSLKGPSATASVNCQGLVATAPKSCIAYFKSFFP